MGSENRAPQDGDPIIWNWMDPQDAEVGKRLRQKSGHLLF
jgi:hypothetical protein